MDLSSMEHIADNSSVMVVVLDEHLRYIYVNAAHAQVSGLSSAQALGRTNAEIFGEQYSRSWDDADRRALRGSKYIVEPNEWVDRSGKLRKFIGTRMRLTIDGKPCVAALVSEIHGTMASALELSAADLRGMIITIAELSSRF